MFANEADLAVFTGDPSLDSPRGALLLETVSAVIRDYCRQTFDLVENDEVELRGTPRPRLLLPERPVVSVGTVTLDGVEVTNFTRVRDGLWRDRGWGGPSHLVTVVYTHGFTAGANALTTLEGVCLQVAARAAVNTRSATQESIGDWSASWGSAGGGFALNSAEQSILDRFKHEHAS